MCRRWVKEDEDCCLQEVVKPAQECLEWQGAGETVMKDRQASELRSKSTYQYCCSSICTAVPASICAVVMYICTAVPMHLQVGQLSLVCPLPPGWEWEEVREGSGGKVWRHAESGKTRDTSPMDPYFTELRDRRRRALAR